jgi:hypothetical protein
MTSCEITKRRYLPGYSVLFLKWKGKSNTIKASVQIEDNQNDTCQIIKLGRMELSQTLMLDLNDSLSFYNALDSSLKLDESEVASHQFIGSFNINHVRKNTVFRKQEQRSVEKPKTETESYKKWKKVGLVALITTLIVLFIWAGAMWPHIYIVWMGLGSLLALLGISSSIGTESWKERILVFFIGLFFTAIYVIIYLFIFSVWQAMLFQLAIFGVFGLILILSFWLAKRKIIKSKEEPESEAELLPEIQEKFKIE